MENREYTISMTLFKRKKRHGKKLDKKRELKGGLKGWEYGASVAKEVLLRCLFRKAKQSGDFDKL
jgi:hypothetical protein